ncbi:MAG: hypothetical protein ACRDOE_01660, partial [Streptosporangiaceae bacterium]
LGPVLSPLWNNHVPMGGSPAGATVYLRTMEQLGFFTALGVVIVFVAATALGRIASVTSGIRTVEEVPETQPLSGVPAETAPVDAVPASALPVRTRADAVPAQQVRTEGDPATEFRPARTEDTTPTVE